MARRFAPQSARLLDFRRRVLGRQRGFACDVAFLRGAQEEMWQKLLQLQFAPNPGEVLAWMVKAGVEATVRAYGGDLRQGFAATRDGPRTITRWTGALRAAMNADAGPHQSVFGAPPRCVHRRPRTAVRPCRGRSVAPAGRAGRRILVGSGRHPRSDRPVRRIRPRRQRHRPAAARPCRARIRGLARRRRGRRRAALLAACFGATGAIVDQVEA